MDSLLAVDQPWSLLHVCLISEQLCYIVRSYQDCGWCTQWNAHTGLTYSRFAWFFKEAFISLLHFLLYPLFTKLACDCDSQNIDKIGKVTCPVMVMHVSFGLCNHINCQFSIELCDIGFVFYNNHGRRLLCIFSAFIYNCYF